MESFLHSWHNLRLSIYFPSRAHLFKEAFEIGGHGVMGCFTNRTSRKLIFIFWFLKHHRNISKLEKFGNFLKNVEYFYILKSWHKTLVLTIGRHGSNFGDILNFKIELRLVFEIFIKRVRGGRLTREATTYEICVWLT